MKNLVFIQNGKVITDSLTVAEAFGKNHNHVMRDIETQIVKLVEAGEQEFSLSNFGRSEYENDRGRIYNKYNLSEDAFALIAMSYVTPEAMKFKVQFLQEFKRIKAELQKSIKPLSEREQLIASMKMTIEMSEEMATVKDDVAELKDKVDNQMTIDYGQQSAILAAKNKRVEKLWFDGDLPEEIFDTKKKLHARAWRDLKRAFAVASYRDIRRKDFEEAMNFLSGWRPAVIFGGENR